MDRALRYLMTAIMGCCWILGICEDFKLSGNIKSSDGTPLKACFMLKQRETGEIAAKAICDYSGHYELEAPEGEYQLVIECDGYLPLIAPFTLSQDLSGFNLPMSPDPEAQTRELEEVKVIAKALQSYADRDEMFLSDYNRNFGVNALDAISSLPKFIPNLNGSALLNDRMESVNILIDGHKASAEDLRNLNGKDIAKVIYYQNAPAKYAGLYGGCIANIILKRPLSIKFSGKFEAGANLTSPVTNETVGFTMLSPTTIINANYKFIYSNITRQQSGTTFDYGDLINSLKTTSFRVEQKNNQGAISWQFDRGSNMFFAKFDYNGNDRHVSKGDGLTETTSMDEIYGTRNTTGQRFSDTYSLNLYYSHQFKNGMELMADIVGNISKPHTDSHIIQNTEESSAYNSYTVNSEIGSNVKSIIGNVSFNSPLWGGSASISAMEHYRDVRQTYHSNLFSGLPSINRNSTHYTMLAASFTRQFGKFSGMIDLTLSGNIFKDIDGKSHFDYSLYPRLNLNYNLNRSVNLHMTTWMEGTIYGLGQQNINRSFIDTRFFKENIPYMKPSHRMNISLSPTFSISSGVLSISPNLWYTWSRNSYIDYIYREGNDFIQRPILLPCMNSLKYGVSMIWYALPGFQLRPFIDGSYKAFSTPQGHERFNAVKFRLMGIYVIKRFQFTAYVESPKKEIDGITRSHTGWRVSADALWSSDNLYIGLSYYYGGAHEWTSMAVDGFSWQTDEIAKYLRDSITLTVGYNFSAGKYNRSRHNKKLYNQETESGL